MDYLFTYISNYYGIKLYERNTLFIFDGQPWRNAINGHVKALDRFWPGDWRRFKEAVSEFELRSRVQDDDEYNNAEGQASIVPSDED